MKDYNVAIVGATGAVGREVLGLLQKRNFPTRNLRFFGRSSVGTRLTFQSRPITVEALTSGGVFEDSHLVIFTAGSEVAKQWAPAAVHSGCTVIDNSSWFRLNPEVPLVIPEINGDVLDNWSGKGIISNPNCTTAITLMALWPLHYEFWVKRVIASSYQAVSGAGQAGIDELQSQANAISLGQPESVGSKFFPVRIAFNVIPEIGRVAPNDYTDEELKLSREGAKIMRLEHLNASITCVRVPVYRCHSVAVTVEFDREPVLVRAREVLIAQPGLVFSRFTYPTPLSVEGRDECYVGRVRRSSVFKNGLDFWVVGDQLLKGAALNAVQIAERLVSVNRLRSN